MNRSLARPLWCANFSVLLRSRLCPVAQTEVGAWKDPLRRAHSQLYKGWVHFLHPQAQ